MDLTDRYWVVQCPNCGRLMMYQNIYLNKKNYRKKCPYCNKTFTIIRKNRPSWEIVKFTADNPKDANEFIRKYKFMKR